MVQKIKSIAARRMDFFRDAKNENAVNNLRTLQRSSMVAIALLIFFLGAAPIIISGWRPSLQHVIFLPVIICFALAVEIYAGKGGRSPKTVTVLCVLFQVIVFLFVLLIDAESDRNAPASFMPIICVVLPILFVLPDRINYGIMCLFAGGYIVAASFLKTDKVILQHDAFQVVSAIFFALTAGQIVTEMRVQEYERLVKYDMLSKRDTLLTEIYNKQTCQEKMSDYLYANAPSVNAALVILDLDDFKTINDTYGHYNGDLILRSVGRAMNDSFGDDGIVARFGGDEFMAFVPDCTSEEKLMERCRHVSESVKKFTAGQYEITVNCSAGGLLVENQDVRDYDALFCQADEALYDAKRQGKNRTVIRKYDESMAAMHGFGGDAAQSHAHSQNGAGRQHRPQ